MVSLICQTEVAADDPAFTHPTKFVGPVYSEEEAHRLATLRGWQVSPDGSSWRRVVASPEPLKMLELHTIRLLLADGAVVICAGGGGIPVLRDRDGRLRGAEAVIDKDLGASLLAQDLPGRRPGDPHRRGECRNRLWHGRGAAHRPYHCLCPAVHHVSRRVDGPEDRSGVPLGGGEFAGNPAMIGRLDQAADLVRGTCGTIIEKEARSSRTP